MLLAGAFGARPPAPRPGGNTTIAVVATNARLTKAEVNRVAIMADDGFARAIRPSHTVGDGDTVFVLATGQNAAANPTDRRRAGGGGAGRSHRARGGAGAGARRPARGPRSRHGAGPLPVSFHLVVVALYSFAIVGMGVWTSRLVRTSSEFFVAGRSLGAGLVFSSMLAANIGAGSLFGASGLAYRDGVSAWWWVGSAGLGSLVFAFAVAPRLWALAKEHDFYTTGDYLEFRYGATVRGVATALVGIGALALLAGQLIAGATILNLLTGMPRWAGALTGGAIMTIYFTSGGLLGSAWINTAQLVVMVVGLGLAVPAALLSVGGLGNLLVDAPAFLVDPMYSAGPGSGWTLLALTGPAFIVSPGLIQKAYGARSANAVRVGVAANALALLAFAVRAGAAGPGRAGGRAGHREPQRGAAPRAHAAAAAVARRDRAGGGVLHRRGHLRRRAVHDLQLGDQGSLQALHQPGGQRRDAAARRPPDHGGRRRWSASCWRSCSTP